MGTAKRERQKANRALKLEQQAKQERVEKVKRTGTRWLLTAGGLVLVIVVILWASGAFSGDDDLGSDTSTTATATATASATGTADAVTTTTYPAMTTPTVTPPETAPTELKVTTLTPGDGPKVVAGDTVTVYYVGVNQSDGVQFDNSYEPPRTFDVTVGAGTVIKGWDEGFIGLQKGGRYQLDIPADLAYGATGSPPAIGPDAALTFVVDVLNVRSAG